MHSDCVFDDYVEHRWSNDREKYVTATQSAETV
jgi:hypothetical protein